MDGKGQEILIANYISSCYNMLGSDNLCELSTLTLYRYRTNSGRSKNSNTMRPFAARCLSTYLKQLAHGRFLFLVFFIK